MRNARSIPGEFVDFVNCEELIRSAGIQLATLAYDIAFTDAAFGEEWSVEAADRLACLSELLLELYKRLPSDTLTIRVPLPEGVIGQVAINPRYKEPAEKPVPKDTGDSDNSGGVQNSIDDFPF